MYALKQSQSQVDLDPDIKCDTARNFEAGLRSLVIGQEQAISGISSLYQIFRAGMSDPNRPLGTMLLLGPTGSGKTHVVESAAQILFGDTSALIRIDCAEFQERHEIAKLIGSPPGYLGHRETPPLLTQARLESRHTEHDPFSIVLFDEIEKASEALWQLLLGILDKGTLTTGDNRRVDFSQSMIFMTSNLGAREMSELMTGAIGFAPPQSLGLAGDGLSQKIDRTATDAARRHFSPEFMNRLDRVVVFRTLSHADLRKVLDLELDKVRSRIEDGATEVFDFTVTEGAREFLLEQGINSQYGARHLKRAIERFLVVPLANLAATKQARLGDMVIVDFDGSNERLRFRRDQNDSTLAAAASSASFSAQSSLKNDKRRSSWLDLRQPVRRPANDTFPAR